MGRLELAGINPATTPVSRFWRALWALFVEYKATFGPEADADVRALWAQLSGQQTPAAPAAQGSGEQAQRPAPPPAARPRVMTDVPIDPETGQPRRPTAAEREAWALSAGANGANDLLGMAGGGRSGAAEKVGG